MKNSKLVLYSTPRRTFVKRGTGTLLALTLVDWLPELNADPPPCVLPEGDSVCGPQPGGSLDTDATCGTQNVGGSIYSDVDGNCGNTNPSHSNLYDPDQNCGWRQPNSSALDPDESCAKELGSSQSSPDEACNNGAYSENDPDSGCSSQERDESCSSIGTSSFSPDEHCGRGIPADPDNHCSVNGDPDNTYSYLA